MASTNKADKTKTLEAVSRNNPASYLTAPTVAITIGETKKKYHVHETLLTTYSEYFNGCLGPGFVEGKTRSVTLKDENELFFKTFINWLYGEIPILTALLNAHDVSAIAVGLYCLGDRMMAEKFKNDIVDQLRLSLKDRKRTPAARHILMIREQGLLNSKLGQFLVEQFAWRTRFSGQSVYIETESRKTDREQAGAFEKLYADPEAASAVLKETVEHDKQNWVDPLFRTGCVYHEHEIEKKCTRN